MDNQEIKADAGKLAISTVPTEAIEAIAVIRQYGIKKYGSKESWKQVSIPRYREAVLRHILHWWKDPNAIDEESGLPSLWHALCNMAFIIALEKEQPITTNTVTSGYITTIDTSQYAAPKKPTRANITGPITAHALDMVHEKLKQKTKECRTLPELQQESVESVATTEYQKRFKAIMKEQTNKALKDFAEAYDTSLINWRDVHQEKWHIVLIHSPNSNGATVITVASSQTVEQPNSVYFTSREIALAAIRTVGEKEIKKYLFGKED